MRFKTYLSELTEAAFAYTATKYLPAVLDRIKKGTPINLGKDGSSSVKIKYTSDLERIHNQSPDRLATAKGIEFEGEDDKIYRYTQFYKGDFSTGGSGAGAANTKLTECAQCAYLGMLVHGIEPIPENINQVKEYFDVDETISSMQEMSDSWVQSSIFGAEKIQQNIKGLKQMIFHRGSSLVQAIEDKFKVLNIRSGKPFSNINKFTPADIWLVDNNTDVKKDISNIETLESFRNYFKSQFHSNKLIGVSLKKVDKANPPWSVYNDGEFNKAKYINTDISKSKKLFIDSIDIYVNFDYHGKGRCQFRSFSGGPTSWQGEIKGKTSAAGKIGGGVVQYMTKKYLKKPLTDPSDITKATRKMDKRFLDKFWYYIKDCGVYNITKEEYNQKVQTADPKYIYSKFLGLELNYIMKNSTSAQCDAFMTELVGYASSNTSESAIFVKMGN